MTIENAVYIGTVHPVIIFLRHFNCLLFNADIIIVWYMIHSKKENPTNDVYLLKIK